MKEHPSKLPKIHYTVTLDGEEFSTWAYNPHGAKSNAAFRLAQIEGVKVNLIMWKIQEGDIECKVEVIKT